MKNTHFFLHSFCQSATLTVLSVMSPQRFQASEERDLSGDGSLTGGSEVIFLRGEAFGDHLIDHPPVGETSEIPVIYEKVCLEFAWCCRHLLSFVIFLGMVAVDRIEFQAASAAPVDGFLEQPSFSYRPEYEGVAIGLDAFQCRHGERNLLADFRVFVFDYCSIEINRNDHSVNGILCPDKILGLGTCCKRLDAKELG